MDDTGRFLKGIEIDSDFNDSSRKGFLFKKSNNKLNSKKSSLNPASSSSERRRKNTRENVLPKIKLNDGKGMCITISNDGGSSGSLGSASKISAAPIKKELSKSPSLLLDMPDSILNIKRTKKKILTRPITSHAQASQSGHHSPEISASFDLDSHLAKMENIRARVWGDHVLKAQEQSEIQKMEAATKKKKKTISFLNASFSESVGDLSQSWKKAMKVTTGNTMSCTELMRKLGLSKEDVFTGTEAKALKKLLQTLRWKQWNPELYFHIRFFSLRHKLHSISDEAKTLVKARWHFILKMLRTMRKIQDVLAQRSVEMTENCVTCVDMIREAVKPVCWDNNPELTFDKHAYQVHTDITVTFDTLNILCEVNPDDRTEEDIEVVVCSLQYVDDFAKIPTHMQFEMARVAFYQRVGSNRVIVRQGHVPQYYYYVLMGQAIAKRFRSDGLTEMTAVHKKGDGFGSMAIVNKTLRRSTVISMTPVHLLAIPKNAMGHLEGIPMELSYLDVINFFSRMWFMAGWPMEHLVKCPSRAKSMQFRRTEIIERDSFESDWIYVVIKGTLRVYQPTALKKAWLNVLSGGSRGRAQKHGSRRGSFFPCSSILKDLPQDACHYKLVDSLRYLDVFGLEDLCLDPRHPPPIRHLLLISDGVECAMLSKKFFLKMSNPRHRKKVFDHLETRKLTYTQITSTDCLLIPLGGVHKKADCIADPIDPKFCTHC